MTTRMIDSPFDCQICGRQGQHCNNPDTCSEFKRKEMSSKNLKDYGPEDITKLTAHGETMGDIALEYFDLTGDVNAHAVGYIKDMPSASMILTPGFTHITARVVLRLTREYGSKTAQAWLNTVTMQAMERLREEAEQTGTGDAGAAPDGDDPAGAADRHPEAPQG